MTAMLGDEEVDTEDGAAQEKDVQVDKDALTWAQDVDVGPIDMLF